MRFHVHFTESLKDEALERPFVCPNSIDGWRLNTKQLLPETTDKDLTRLRYSLISDISHRFQYVEFLNALLLLDYERFKSKQESSLHSTVKYYLMHAHCISVHSVFEGVGSYIYRHNQFSKVEKYTPDINNEVQTSSYLDTIKKKMKNTFDKEEFKSDIGIVESVRNSQHLSRIKDNIDYNKLNYNLTYIPSHRALKNYLIDNLNDNKVKCSNIFENI